MSGGGFLSSSRGSRCEVRCLIPSGGVASFRRGGDDIKAGVPRHSHDGLPSVPRLIPIPISKRQDGKQANGKGRTVSAIVSRRTTEDKQARRERRTTPPHPYHHTTNDNPTGSITCPINTSPRLTTSTNETQDETPETMKRNEGEHRNDGRTTERKRTTPQDDKQTRDARTRRRTRRQTRRDEETTRARASKYGNEDKRTGKNKTPHFLTSRPTPFRQISLIRRPQLFPRPRSGDERASKQVRLSHVSSVARRVPITHALASSAIAHPGPYPPPHILITGVIFPNAPF